MPTSRSFGIKRPTHGPVKEKSGKNKRHTATALVSVSRCTFPADVTSFLVSIDAVRNLLTR
jgi:hypothetical protein